MFYGGRKPDEVVDAKQRPVFSQRSVRFRVLLISEECQLSTGMSELGHVDFPKPYENICNGRGEPRSFVYTKF